MIEKTIAWKKHSARPKNAKQATTKKGSSSKNQTATMIVAEAGAAKTSLLVSSHNTHTLKKQSKKHLNLGLNSLLLVSMTVRPRVTICHHMVNQNVIISMSCDGRIVAHILWKIIA